MEQQEPGTITLKKDTLWKGAAFLFAALFIISLFTGGFGFGSTPGTGNVVANTGTNPNPTPSPEPSPVAVSADDDAFIGDEDAPVTIIEFSDYECPFCGRHYSQTYVQIKENYIDTGKVKYVMRDFPLSFHPMAQPAAEAAECVRAEGGDEAYFEYHDTLFANQPQLSEANLLKWASDMGYDIEECLESGEFSAEVQKDLADGQAAGVRGTPGFFVNGKPISGAQPYSVFEQAIEAELA